VRQSLGQAAIPQTVDFTHKIGEKIDAGVRVRTRSFVDTHLDMSTARSSTDHPVCASRLTVMAYGMRADLNAVSEEPSEAVRQRPTAVVLA
jgi:hypothetical protein